MAHTYAATTRSKREMVLWCLFVLFFLACLPSTPIQAATYYIDQTGGNDNNNGTSQNSPWKNAPGMSSYSGSQSLQPGDIVYFDRDDVWLVTGGQGLYLVGGVTYIGDSWERDGGTSGARATIRAAANLEAGVVRFRDHPTLPTTLKGFDVDANNKVTSGIDINHRYWQSMSGAMKRVQDVEVHHVDSRKANNEYKYGIIVSNFGGNAGFTQNVEILDCVVHDISRDAIALYPGDGVNDSIRFVTVRGCEVYNTGQDPGYDEGHGFTIKGWVRDSIVEYNYVHDVNSSAVFFSGPENDGNQRSAENVIIRHNILTSQDNNGIIRLYSKGAKEIEIYGNLVFDNSDTGGLSLAGASSGTLDLLVYNNVFYNTYVDLGGHSMTVGALEFKNNIVQYSSNQLRNGNSITGQSNNILTSSNPGLINPNNKPSGFVGVHGVDLRPNTDGFMLVSGGSGHDGGASLGSGYGSSINSVPRPGGGAWDIGAYEIGSGGAIPSCDVNQNGTVDVSDVQLSVNMALGTTPCTIDIMGPGVCDVVVVQRIVNTALGGMCVIDNAPPPPLPTVFLTWTPSVSANVVGHNVYRGTSPGGPYPTKLNSALVVPANFTDNSVQTGQTYYYVVTAVDSNDAESIESNEIAAIVPSS